VRKRASAVDLLKEKLSQGRDRLLGFLDVALEVTCQGMQASPFRLRDEAPP
jgi:hypothetical protein